MLDREWRTLVDIVRIERTHPLELLGGISAILRGAWVAIFAGDIHAHPVAEYLEALAPVAAWGLAVLGAGLLQLWALARDDTKLRRAANMALVALIGAILLGYLLHDPESVAVPLYVTMFLKQFWIAGRARSPANRGRVRIVPRNGDASAALNGG